MHRGGTAELPGPQRAPTSSRGAPSRENVGAEEAGSGGDKAHQDVGRGPPRRRGPRRRSRRCGAAGTRANGRVAWVPGRAGAAASAGARTRANGGARRHAPPGGTHSWYPPPDSGLRALPQLVAHARCHHVRYARQSASFPCGRRARMLQHSANGMLALPPLSSASAGPHVFARRMSVALMCAAYVCVVELCAVVC